MIGANTATVNGGHAKSINVDAVVCGNEILAKASLTARSSYVAQKDQLLSISSSEYRSYFKATYNSVNCHEDCIALIYSFY